MKVRATKPGFIHSRLQGVGDVFDVSDALFSAKWMEEVKEPEAVVEKKAPKETFNTIKPTAALPFEAKRPASKKKAAKAKKAAKKVDDGTE